MKTSPLNRPLVLRRHAALIAALAFLALHLATAKPEDEKKASSVKFSHRLHVRDAGAACLDCHGGAPASPSAGDNLLAKKANCEACHAEQLESNCTFCHFSEDASTYKPFPNPDRDLVFAHDFHIAQQHMECVTCHTGIEDAEDANVGHLPAMPVCSTCHNDVAASNQCERCHLDFAALRPSDHNVMEFQTEHKRLVRSGQSSCSMCHTDASCEECHATVPLLRSQEARIDLISPRSPRISAIDRGQELTLQKVHDMNFRYTHGVAAAGKVSECSTCHETQEFCAACHAAGGNVTQGEFRPSSHTQAFVAGQHGAAARRDIETCAACHDASGAEPTCVLCHADPDGVRGTNVSIHPSGFMRSEEGPWHTDQGANCYVCHTDPYAHAGGVPTGGFCRYCHQ